MEAAKLLIMIPAYNEEDSIGEVIARVKQGAPFADIVVINDGSTDATAAIAERMGALASAVISLPYNLGIGAAMQTGYIFAREMGYDGYSGYSVAVQVDADGQHDPAEISALIAPVLKGEADIVIGSRYIEERGYITPFLRRVGIFILAHIISFIIGRKRSGVFCKQSGVTCKRSGVTDTTSGFRAVNRQVIEFCAREYPQDYPEPESLVLFHRAGFTIKEIPVTMNPRYGGESSITPFRSFYYMIKVLLTIFIGLLREPPVRSVFS